MRDRYTVELTEQATKDVRKLRPWAEQVIRNLLILETEPMRGHVLTGSLRGARSLEFSLKGSGVFRAVYIVRDDHRVCLVFIVGPHENIYDRAERRILAVRRALDDE